MNPRERVIASLDHRSPDAVPVDFGATPITGMHCSCVAALRRHYGLEPRPVKVDEPYQMLGLIEEDLKQAIGVDVEGLLRNKTLFGFVNEDWKPWRTPWGQDVLVPRDFQTTTDYGGDVYIHPQGDLAAPASGHMPKTGFFFDTIIRQPPIDEDRLDPRDNLEEFGPIDDDQLAHYRQGVTAAKNTGRAVIIALPGTSIGDIAHVPAPGLKRPKGIRDVAEWYMSLAARPDYVREVFAGQVEQAMTNLAAVHDAVGNDPDVVVLCGTDFGTQQSTFCSDETFRQMYMPYYRQMTDWIHRHTTWRVFKHSCGSVVSLLDAFLDAGFDILNPVQCSAAGMDPEHLKSKYGDRLVFWGGGVDTQKVLPFGTPEQVRRQVLERCEVFARDGGFVFNAIHNVQAKTPVENIVAMLDAVHEFNGQPV
jgi:hypothetical protein